MGSKVVMACIGAAITLCVAAPAAGQANSAWHRNTWNLTQFEPATRRFGRGVFHAYFRVPLNSSREARAAVLKVRTPNDTKVRLNCQLLLGGTRLAAFAHLKASAHEHVVAFTLPSSPSYRSVRATATCLTTARIDAAWQSSGPSGDLYTLGRYPWRKLHRT